MAEEPAGSGVGAGEEAGDATAAEEPAPPATSSALPEVDADTRIENLASIQEAAVGGRLESAQVSFLQSFPQGHAEFERSRSLLITNAEANGDQTVQCAIANEVVSLRQYQYQPKWIIEQSKCHLRRSEFSEALSTAKRAESYAQDLPSSQRFDRLMFILSLQANAYKGLYQMSEDTRFLDDAVQVWNRYKVMAEQTNRASDVRKAERNIRRLMELQQGAM